jgi:hypothetical protein
MWLSLRRFITGSQIPEKNKHGTEVLIDKSQNEVGSLNWDKLKRISYAALVGWYRSFMMTRMRRFQKQSWLLEPSQMETVICCCREIANRARNVVA